MATDLTRFSRYRFRHFDRDADFVVLRSIRVGGRDLRPGDYFDKTMTTLRMHKVLFQQRKIDEVGGCWHKISGLPAPVKATAVSVSDIVAALPQERQDKIETRAVALAAEVPAKRKGRPKGSKNKPRE